MPDNSRPLTYITRCLFCDFTATETGFEAVDLNNLEGKQQERLATFHMKLLGHVQRGAQNEERQIKKLLEAHQKNGGTLPDTSGAKHFALWQTFVTRTMLAQSSAVLSGFRSEDPHLNSLREAGRWRLHEITRRTYFTDQMLADALVKLELDEPAQDKVLRLMIEVRDALLEQGKYEPRPEAAEPQPLIVLA